MSRRDLDRFRHNVQRRRETMRTLHRQHGIRPVTSFAVLAQSPVLFALYWRLTSPEVVPARVSAPFVWIERLSISVVAGAGLGAVALLLLVGATTWYGFHQTARSAPATAGAPRRAMIGVAATVVTVGVAATLPAGMLLYWATSGLWTVAQQGMLIR